MPRQLQKYVEPASCTSKAFREALEFAWGPEINALRGCARRIGARASYSSVLLNAVSPARPAS